MKLNEALQNIIEHYLADEQEHYQGAPDSQNHIYHSLKAVEEYLSTQEKGE